MAYATTEELEARWRPLTPEEQKVANTLLGDASAILDSKGFYDADESILRIVACNMVRRAMEVTGDAFNIDGQVAPSTGWNSVLPAGAMQPLDREIAMLRGGARAGFVRMTSRSCGC